MGANFGVVRTRVGYAGGTTKNPTYHNLSDHSETIQVDYNPTQISYSDLLDIFWESHSPTHRSWSRQYMSAVFYHNEDQKRLAMETRKLEASKVNSEIYTEIIPHTEFYLAEDYHQKHALQRDLDLMEEFKGMYPNFREIINSTAAARINGYLAGYGTCEILKSELESYGLSLKGIKKVSNLICGQRTIIPCLASKCNSVLS